MNLDNKLLTMIGDDKLKVPGLGVIVCRNGKEIFSAFHGQRNLTTGKPVTRKTRFRAASVSKMFTIFSIMQLAEQGKINLDDDAGNYLDFNLRNPAAPQKKITVRMLASHTSSLRDGKIYSIPPNFSVKEFFDPQGKFFENGAHFAPAQETVGEYFTYANLNYGLLGTIIECVTGQRFDLWQRKNIFRQLDIKADYLPGNLQPSEFNLLGTIYRKQNPPGQRNEQGTWFATVDDFNEIQPPHDTVQLQNPYAENFQDVFNLKNYKVGTNATIFSPQGGLRISFDELANALQMIMNNGTFSGNQILKRESVSAILTPHWIFNGKNGDTCGGVMLNYALATYSIDGKSRARVCRNHVINLVGHTGAAFGLLSGFFLRPNSRDGFVYMLNGLPVAENVDPQSRGNFSSNYIWEEKIMDAICNEFFAEI